MLFLGVPVADLSDVALRLSFELRRWRDLDAIVPEWAALASRAEIANVFFDPDFALPAAKALDVEDQLQAALFWTGEKEQRRLAGFVPLITRRRWLITPRNLEVWTHPYAPASLPLVEPDVSDALDQALVRGLAATPRLPRIMVLPHLLLDSAFAVQLLGAGAPLFVHGGYQRPMAQKPLDGAGYLAHALRSNRRNRLKRQARQLEAKGRLVFRMIADRAALKDACARFLALEAQGWKGRAGTALASSPQGKALFAGVTEQFTAGARLQVAELMLDDGPIASLVILCTPGHYWFWKIAFDERHADQSPGRMLLVRATEAVLDATPGAIIDSCATDGAHFSGNVLRERVAMGDVLLSTRPRPNIIFRAANALEALRNHARTVRQQKRAEEES